MFFNMIYKIQSQVIGTEYNCITIGNALVSYHGVLLVTSYIVVCAAEMCRHFRFLIYHFDFNILML